MCLDKREDETLEEPKAPSAALTIVGSIITVHHFVNDTGSLSNAGQVSNQQGVIVFLETKMRKQGRDEEKEKYSR